MMNLWELLKVSKGLPPPDLETLLLARKISGKSSGSSTITLTANGYPCTFENSVGLPAVGYKIYGNSIQNGTPSPDNPVEVQSVGEPVFAKLYDSAGFRLADSDGYKLCSQDVAGYCIPIVTSGVNRESLITNIYLDEPLRKIGDYADVIDFERGVVERTIGKLVFTGDENIKSGHLNVSLFEFNMTGYLRERKITSLSSHYQTQANVTGYSSVGDMRCAFYANPTVLGSSLIYIRDSRFSTVADFKAYLKGQYEAGTPVTVYYALAEPTTENLALPKIPTFNGTTIITTDTEVEPSDIEITYKLRR